MNANTGTAELDGLEVLIAEDEFLVALELAQSVEALGGEVLGPVAAVSEGLALLQSIQPDLAFLDMQLRDGFVTPLAAALGRLEVPFALITGYRGKETECQPLRHAPRLNKPYRPFDLARMASILRKEVVRRRAHAMWEREGRPEGQAERHWLTAEQQLGSPLSIVAAPGSSTLRSPAQHAAEWPSHLIG